VVYALGYEAGLDKGWRRAMDIVERAESRCSRPNTQRAMEAWKSVLVTGLKIGYRYYKDEAVPDEGPSTLIFPEGVPVGHCSCGGCGHDDATVVILTALNQMEERIMTTIDEFEASMGTKLTELTKDVQRALDIITAGTLSEAQAAAAAAIQTGIDSLDAAVEAVAPEPVTPPAS
jgi:hypothetical protein